MARLLAGPLDPSAPVLPHVDRPALNDVFDAAAARRVCLVVAGPGWGKTTSLTAWTAAAAETVVSLRPGEDGVRRLVSGLLDASRSHPSAAPGDTLSFVDLDQAGDSAAADQWSAAASSADGLVLMVDDAQDLFGGDDPGWEPVRLLDELCGCAPPWLHIVLVSRSEPPLSLERLRGRGLVADVDAHRLAFEVGEVTALLEATTGDSLPESATWIREATGGWPALVRMAAEALGGVAPDRRDGVLEQLVRPGGRVWCYLAEEVFAGEPEPVLELLRTVAILGRVTAPLAGALGLSDAASLLPCLARRGLVQCVPWPEASWSLAPVVRDFFLAEPAVLADQQLELHRRAAGFFAAHRSYAEALRHYTEARDHGAAASLLVEHGIELVDAGHVDLVVAAAELPPAESDPRIQGVLGYARQVRGEWARALDAFQQATAGEDELSSGLAWRMGLVPYGRGELDQAIELYGRARLHREETREEALLLAWTAAAHRMVGDYDRCRQYVARAEAAAAHCHDPNAWAITSTIRAMLAASAGVQVDADAYFSGARQWAAQATGGALETLRVTVSMACYLGELGRVPECLQQVDEALRLEETCGNPVLRASALTARGYARALQGELEAAVGDFATAAETFQGIGSRFLAWPLGGLGYVHQVRGELAHARAAYEEALALSEPCHEVLGLGYALIGLARVRAADDLEDARKLAERAVALDDGSARVQALLTRGWVVLLAGEPAAAAADAGSAAAAARGRRDRPGLAEALELSAFTASARGEALPLLDEAAQIWGEAGYVVDEAQARLVAARLRGDGRATAESAEQALREHGVRAHPPHAAGPLAALTYSVPSVSIRALGVFQVFRDDKPVPAAAWQSRKARDLLKILVARRGPVPREQLMELLWPEEDPTKAGKRLSVLLSTLRAVLGPPRHLSSEGPIVTDRDVVWLDHEQVDVDVEHFLSAAKAALDAHECGVEEATGQLAAVEACYGGDFLEDEPYQEWADSLREEAGTLYAAVLRVLVHRLRQAGDVDHAVRYALRLAQLEPYDEEAHLGLVHTLVEGRRHGEARRRYREYERRMDDLGVPAAAFPEPSPRPERQE